MFLMTNFRRVETGWSSLHVPGCRLLPKVWMFQAVMFLGRFFKSKPPWRTAIMWYVCWRRRSWTTECKLCRSWMFLVANCPCIVSCWPGTNVVRYLSRVLSSAFFKLSNPTVWLEEVMARLRCFWKRCCSTVSSYVLKSMLPGAKQRYGMVFLKWESHEIFHLNFPL